MSATNKTDYLGLNSWAGTDRPERADFNSDNDILDAVVQAHFEDGSVHITDDEREVWNLPYYCGMYVGDGEEERTVTTNCPFDAQFAMVFCNECGPVVLDFDSPAFCNYFAAAAAGGGMAGLALSGADIIVQNNADAAVSSGNLGFNTLGGLYFYILFR